LPFRSSRPQDKDGYVKSAKPHNHRAVSGF
jgi:hypothetical protein